MKTQMTVAAREIQISKSNVSAIELAKMNGRGLSIEGFRSFLSEGKMCGMGYALESAELLQSYLESLPKEEFQLKGFDIPWLIRLADGLVKKARTVRKNRILYNGKAASLRAWVEYILTSRGFDVVEFGFEEARNVYYTYLNSRSYLVAA